MIFQLRDDEMSLYIIVLVQDDSVISNTELVFYNTLFDEKASCYFALARAIPYTMKNRKKYL